MQGDRATQERLGLIVVKGGSGRVTGSLEQLRLLAGIGRDGEGLAQEDHGLLVRAAALGAQGDPATLTVVLAACSDKPAIRRRAVLALAAFEGDAVEAQLRVALTDADWQVRQAAEDLLNIEA